MAPTFMATPFWRHRIVTTVASTALTVLAAGCAAQGTGTGSSLSDPAAAIAARQLSGTWRGFFWQVGGEGTALDGDVALEIRNDATYRLTSTRRGTASNDSGVVVTAGRGITLKSSSGQWTRLMRNGDALYGMAPLSGRHIHIMVERAR